MTRLVLVNAIYFKGEWLNPFEESRTKEGDFLLADGGTSKTKLMTASLEEKTRYGAFNADGSFFNTPLEVPWKENETTVARYPSKDGFAMAELPYKGKGISMVLIAPLSYDGIERIEQELTVDNLSRWISELQEREVEVTLPRFKLETTCRLEEYLSKMGMKSAFTQPQEPGGADFTGIADPENVIDRLYISAAIHKAFLEVNEKGTEAAAASSLLMQCGAAEVAMMPFTPEFKADRPFLLVIRHNTSGAILFMGRVMNPQPGT
jgi:serine protease inhibitor